MQGVEGTVVGDALSRWVDSMGFRTPPKQDAKRSEETSLKSDRQAHALLLVRRVAGLQLAHAQILVLL